MLQKPFLRLTAPSRAIVALDPVDFEIELKIEEGEESQDKELITLSKRYDGTSTSLMFENSLCVAELKFKQITEAVQATVMGVCLVEGDWPFEHGCRVACFAAADVIGPTSSECVLLVCGGKEMHKGSNEYLHLPRNVVSVESHGRLKVVTHAYYSKSDGKAQESQGDIPAQKCQTSHHRCSLGKCMS